MLKDLLAEKKTVILRKWFDRILEIYPTDFQKFLRSQKNPFTNPVGSTIQEGIEGLWPEILQPGDPAKIESFLDGLIRLQAVQDISPSQAIAFMPLLQEVIQEELGDRIREKQVYEEWRKFQAQIRQWTLQSFDIYMDCREKIYQIKFQEWKGATGRVLGKNHSEKRSWKGL